MDNAHVEDLFWSPTNPFRVFYSIQLSNLENGTAIHSGCEKKRDKFLNQRIDQITIQQVSARTVLMAHFGGVLLPKPGAWISYASTEDNIKYRMWRHVQDCYW